MEVASLPAEDGQPSGQVTKRLLQGRPLPAILVDDHPGPRYPTFRPHQRRLSQQKGAPGREGGASTPGDSGVSFSSPEGDALHLQAAKTPGLSSKTSKAKSKRKARKTPVAPPASVVGMASSGLSGVTAAGTATAVAPSTGTGWSGGLGGGGAGGGGGQSHLMSSTSSGVSSLGMTSEQVHRRLAQKANRSSQHTRATTMVEGPDYFVNPEPVPFMPSNFMSSTMLKKIPIPKRHQDTFGGYEYNFTGQRGVMLHTDRYQVRKQYEALKSMEGLNQRDRLLAEMAYLEDLRSIRRRREVVPHRVQLDLFLGGKRLDYEERFDIQREIQRLKAMAMPNRARDLFHGKGIQLPPNHMSVLPRPSRGPVEDSDSEEEFRISAPASLQRTAGQTFPVDFQSPTFERQISLTLGDVPHASSVLRNRRQRLPSISKTQTPRGATGVSTPGSSACYYPQGWGVFPVSFSQGRRRDNTDLSSRHRPRRAAADDTYRSTSQASGHHPSRSAAWVEEQNQLLSQPAPPPATTTTTTTTTPKVVEEKEQEKEQEKEEQEKEQEPSPQSTEVAQKTPGVSLRPEEVSQGQAPMLKSGSSRGRSGQQQVQIQETAGHDTPEAPPVSHTPNPLKAGEFMEVSEEQESSLRQTFQRLDTDMDGHLQYHQLKSQLPKEFSRQQEWFVKQVYEITRSSAAFFGVDEFLMMTQLTNRVAALAGQAQEAYGNIDFDTLEGCIIKYVDLFQTADSGQKGRISVDSLRELLGQSQDKPPPEETSTLWNSVLDSLSLDYASQVNRIEYLAHIPLFMRLAPPSLPPPPPPPPPQSLNPSSFPQI